MLEALLSRNVCVYVMLMLGCIGIMGRGIVTGYLKRLVKGTETMGMTRKRALVEIRKRYEDLASLDAEIRDFDSFVDKYIDRLKLWAVPINIWNGFLKNIAVFVAGTGIFSAVYQYYVVGDRGMAVELFMCGIGVCMAMLVVWNQWDAAWHMRTLRDAVKNYLSNSLANRLAREDRVQRIDNIRPAEGDEADADMPAAARAAAATVKEPSEDSSYDMLLDKVMQKILVDG